jgi:hypothetical protein
MMVLFGEKLATKSLTDFINNIVTDFIKTLPGNSSVKSPTYRRVQQ